jgi:hypothetical protein
LTKFSLRCVTFGTAENDDDVDVELLDNLFGDDGTIAPIIDSLVVEDDVGDVAASSSLN